MTVRVSCIMIFLDGEAFIDEAIRSVVGQDGFDDWELLLVDDGSSDASTAIAQEWARTDQRIRYLEHDGHENRGMSTSRNLGLKHANGDYVAFLDCDDVWLPHKLRIQVGLLDANPHVDATYGPAQEWYSWTGDRADVLRDRLAPIGVQPGTVLHPPELMRVYRRTAGGAVPAICSVLVRRAAVERVGGFEDRFVGSYEDQVFYAKMGLHMTVLVTGTCLDRYRQHPDSACARGIDELTYHPDLLNPTEEQYLRWLESYLDEVGMRDDVVWRDVQRALTVYRHGFHPGLVLNERWRRSEVARMKLLVRRVVPAAIYERVKRLVRHRRVRLGRLRRVGPVNRSVLEIPGTAVEDLLVARFIAQHRASVRGRVLVLGAVHLDGDLEHGAISVTRLSAFQVQRASDAAAAAFASGPYDCIVAAGVLHTLPDPAAALAVLHAALRDGGVLLLTVPGLVQRAEHDRPPPRWGFAESSLRELAERCFGAAVDVTAHGNALTALASLHGLPAEDLTDEELLHRDPDITLLLMLRASRAEQLS